MNGEKEQINLCQKHFDAHDWSDKDVQITGKQSCDICKEKDA